jgi:iron complex transport system substrate-binding protein
LIIFFREGYSILSKPEDLPVHFIFNQEKLSGEKVMVLRSFLGALALSLFFAGCQSGTEKNPVEELFGSQQPDSVYTPSYAKGFSIAYFDDLKLVHIADPWDSTAVGDYVLVGDEQTADRYKNSEIPFVEYPVKSWGAFSSTQVVFAEKIGELKSLKCVAEPHYISNTFVQQQLQKGHIRDVGLASAADVEVLLASAPQFVFVSPFKDNRYGTLKEAGLLLINDCGYLETTPLGRAEWMVFFGAFFDQEEKAAGLFSEIASSYNSIRKEVENSSSTPSVLTGTLFNDVWYIPSGDSYMAAYFKDAGTKYAYGDKPGTGSLALDFETVFNDFRKSDYWLITVNHDGRFTKEDFLQMDDRYGDFEAFQGNQVVFSNTAYSMFFERGIVEPDVVLKDLVACFHPEIYPDYELVYFEFLNE